MWSRQGLSMIGLPRGTPFRHLSLVEAANYYAEVNTGATVRHVQFYSPLPLSRPAATYQPVAGALVAKNIFHTQVTCSCNTSHTLRLIGQFLAHFGLTDNSCKELLVTLSYADEKQIERGISPLFGSNGRERGENARGHVSSF